jgi:hypothetical protein
MSNTHLWRIGADVPAKIRDYLLRRFPPTFSDVHCSKLSYAFRVPHDSEFPDGPLTVVVYGVHRAEYHEALLVRVNGETYRPDGMRFFIALSVVGQSPVAAADIDTSKIQYLDRPLFLKDMRFKCHPLRESVAVSRAA